MCILNPSHIGVLVMMYHLKCYLIALTQTGKIDVLRFRRIHSVGHLPMDLTPTV